jgi:peptide/nickel transport system permease protein
MTLSTPQPPGQDSGSVTVGVEGDQRSADGRAPWYLRLPIISHLRRSVGLQRGMLIVGLVLTGLLLLTALFAPSDRARTVTPIPVGRVARPSAPSRPRRPRILLGTTVTGFDVLSRVDLGDTHRCVGDRLCSGRVLVRRASSWG